jgi:4'-phosphopantetheinyl transferase
VTERNRNLKLREVEARLAGATTSLEPRGDTDRAAMIIDLDRLEESDLRLLVSHGERIEAAAIADRLLRRQFLLRRSFQRAFVRDCIGWTGELAELPMRADREQRPYCLAAPGTWLSFSSSAAIAVAAASMKTQIGIDIEALRPVEDLKGLSQRFLCPSEVKRLSELAEAQRHSAFLRLWTIKEACLKAIGHGLSYGLDKFEVVGAGQRYRVRPPAEFGDGSSWNIDALAVPEGYVASLARYSP